MNKDRHIDKIIVYKRKNRFNWYNVIFYLFIFAVGIILGISIGTYTLLDHVLYGLSGSTFIVNLNETKLVEEFNKTIVPTIINKAKKPSYPNNYFEVEK